MLAQPSPSYATVSYSPAIMTYGIDVTVAAVIENDNRFLMVEELVTGKRVFNQPAGHVESGESLLDAAVRETFEETGYTFQPSQFLGLYLWQKPDSNRSFLRIAFSGPAVAPAHAALLDDGILAPHWLSREELLQRERRLRSPMVLRCIDAYLAGTRYPLEALVHMLPHYNVLAELA